MTKRLPVVMPSSIKEDLEKIPLLSIDDIGKEGKKLYNTELDLAGVKAVHHPIFTNGISYITLSFDVTNLPVRLMPYASMLTGIFRYVNTEHYTYNELSNEINISTGGIGFCQSRPF